MKKKLLCFALMTAILLALSASSLATEGSTDRYAELLSGEFVEQVIQLENKTVTVRVPCELMNEVTYKDIYDLAAGEHVRNGDIVTLLEIGYPVEY